MRSNTDLSYFRTFAGPIDPHAALRSAHRLSLVGLANAKSCPHSFPLHYSEYLVHCILYEVKTKLNS